MAAPHYRASPLLPPTPNARIPGDLDKVLRVAIGKHFQNIIQAFTLARIQQLQVNDELVEGAPGYSDLYFPAKGEPKPWQSFEAYQLQLDTPRLAKGAPKPPKPTPPKSPVTVSTDTKNALASLLLAVADLARHFGHGLKEPLEQLAGANFREANLVRFMMRVVAHFHPLLAGDPMNREMGLTLKLRQKLAALTGGLVDFGLESIVRLVFDFVKAISWLAAARGYGTEKCLTLNLQTLYAIFNTMGAFLPLEEDSLARGVINHIDELRQSIPAEPKAPKASPKAPRAPRAPKAPAAATPPAAAARAPKDAAKLPPKAAAAVKPSTAAARPSASAKPAAAKPPADDDDDDAADPYAAAGGAAGEVMPEAEEGLRTEDEEDADEEEEEEEEDEDVDEDVDEDEEASS